jgi:TolB-like protein/Tfp pilus assembly protein PilF
MKAFLKELRSRNVDRAALAYAGAAWLLAQGGQLLADAYQWSGWVIRALLAALMLGFPLVLMLAWFFEWTPTGLVAEGSTAATSAIRLRTRRKLDVAIALVLLAALGYLAATRDWRSAGSPPAPVAPPATLAVLPFKPLLAAMRDEALELGMTDTLIARLSSIEEVTVRPLSSVRRYGGLEQDALAAGRELEVASVLDGSIQQLDDRLRVTVRLLSVSDGRQLWSAQFDEQRDDVFAVQDSIATRVLDALAVRLSASDRRRAERFRSRDPEAWHLYVMARGLWPTRKVESTDRAISYLERAIELEPQHPLLHAGLAECYTIKAVFGTEPPRPWFARAKAAVERALELDPELPDALLTRAHLRAHYDLDWAGAEEEYAAVVAADPGNANAHYRLGLMRGFSGRIEEGQSELAVARQLEPHWAPAIANSAFLWTLAGRNAEAEARRAIEIDPGFPYAQSILGRALVGQGRYEEALELFRTRRTPGPRGYADVAFALVSAGRLDEARAELDRLSALARERYVPAYDIAVVHALLGDDAATFDWLEKAIGERSTVALVPADPALRSLRANPRFQEFVARLRVRGPV